MLVMTIERFFLHRGDSRIGAHHLLIIFDVFLFGSGVTAVRAVQNIREGLLAEEVLPRSHFHVDPSRFRLRGLMCPLQQEKV